MSELLPLLNDESWRLPGGTESGLGTLSTERGNLPLKVVDVRGRITDGFAEVVLRQTFVNPFDVALEATYIFPLPDRAAVTGCQMEVAGRVVTAALMERGEARRHYDEALEQGHRAALAEEDRPGVFTLSLGNLVPREAATIELRFSGPLPCEDGEVTFRFPLVVAPRYVPGKPLEGGSVGDGVAHDTDAVPDASRISPPVLLQGFPNPVRLSLEVELLQAGLVEGSLRSSLHAAQVKTSGKRIRISLQPDERLDRDFVLRYRLAENELKSSLLLVPDAQGDEGTFQLTVLAPRAQGTRPRDVVFVLDRSGSMEGWKIVAARRALGRMLDTLSASDRFSVLVFSDGLQGVPELPFEALHPATDRNRWIALEYLAQVTANGGTEMARPLSHAASLLGSGHLERERILVLVTDGQVSNEDQLVKLLDQTRGLRIFPVGIDQAVNAGFLNRLAALGGGRVELVESEARLDEALERVHRSLATPSLSELSIVGEGLEVLSETVAPPRLPLVFPGVPAQILGRYRGKSDGALVVQGTLPSGTAHRELVSGVQVDAPALTAHWARAHLRALEDTYAAHPERHGQLERLIADTSMRFGVLCRFTAFVAIDRAEVVNKGGPDHHVTQPVEKPAGWDIKDKIRLLNEDAAKHVDNTGAADHLFTPVEMDKIVITRRSEKRDEKREIPRRPSSSNAPTNGYSVDRPMLQRSNKTQAGVARGDFHHLSPESIRGIPLTPRSDVFLLGVLLWESLTGDRLFTAESDFAVIEKIVRGRLPVPLLPDASLSVFEPLLQKALMLDPDQRFADCTAFADALAQLISSGAVPAFSGDLEAVLEQLAPEGVKRLRSWLERAKQQKVSAGEIVQVERISIGSETDQWLAARGRPDGNSEPVVVKQLLTEDDEYVVWFVAESMQALGAAHANAIRVLDVTAQPGPPRALLEFVPGLSLRELIAASRKRQEQLPVALIAWVVEQVARAMGVANAFVDPSRGTLGIVRSKLDTGDVLLGLDGSVKLLGFVGVRGWAAASPPNKLAESSAASATKTS